MFVNIDQHDKTVKYQIKCQEGALLLTAAMSPTQLHISACISGPKTYRMRQNGQLLLKWRGKILRRLLRASSARSISGTLYIEF